MKDKLPIPCIHRVFSGQKNATMEMYHSLGMAIEYKSLVFRLRKLNEAAEKCGVRPGSIFVTFDDGWRDCTLLTAELSSMHYLQPVLFLTMKHLMGDKSLLPLPRLYSWGGLNGHSIKDLTIKGIQRKQLKEMPEDEQHRLLDRYKIPRIEDSDELLTDDNIKALLDGGWLLASHGHEHCYLDNSDPSLLREGLTKALEITLSKNGRPWFAWPEGRCTRGACQIAASAGFEKQFSLRVESGNLNFDGIIHRDIWS